MRDVAIIGAGSTKFGELWGQSFRSLGLEAGMKAMASAGLSGEEIEAIYIGNMSSRFIKQQHIDALVADYTGMAGKHVASTSIEAGGASGGVAFRQGVMAVASGMHDVVIVGGAEKMTDLDDDSVNEVMNGTSDAELQRCVPMISNLNSSKAGTSSTWKAILSPTQPCSERPSKPQKHKA